MARKKNSELTSPSLTLGTTEDTQVINSADIEAKEAELLNDSEESSEDEAMSTKLTDKKEDKSIDAKSDVDTSEVTENKPKRQRRSRKAITAEAILASQAQNPSLDLSQEVVLAKEAVELTLNTMVSQFSAIKELTAHVNTQLERMTLLIKDMSPNHSPNLDELVKPPVNTQFITKFATAASLLAVLVSIFSLSMSQSARQTLLSASMNPNKETVAGQSSHSKDSSNELALNNKETSFRKKNRK